MQFEYANQNGTPVKSHGLSKKNLLRYPLEYVFKEVERQMNRTSSATAAKTSTTTCSSSVASSSTSSSSHHQQSEHLSAADANGGLPAEERVFFEVVEESEELSVPRETSKSNTGNGLCSSAGKSKLVSLFARTNKDTSEYAFFSV